MQIGELLHLKLDTIVVFFGQKDVSFYIKYMLCERMMRSFDVSKTMR